MNLRAIWRALRPKQWTKNAILLAALVFALGDSGQQVPAYAWLTALAAMVLFCAASSGIYVLNDLRDVEKDRLHPTKRLRPFAAGDLSPGAGWVLSALLLAAALAGAWMIGAGFLQVVAGYIALQLAYTFALKKVALLDIFIIAAGFVLRALAGAVAIHVAISPWLLVCTLLLALFLALCKRRHELVVVADAGGETRAALRDYSERLLDQLIAVTGGATLVSYCLYTLAPDTVAKFGTNRLALTIPFVIFGLYRYLDLVYRHDQGGRPEQILLTDIPLLVNVLLYGLTAGYILVSLPH
jgi:4-hydroxybenzoate polyprenyltransferase